MAESNSSSYKRSRSSSSSSYSSRTRHGLICQSSSLLDTNQGLLGQAEHLLGVTTRTTHSSMGSHHSKPSATSTHNTSEASHNSHHSKPSVSSHYVTTTSSNHNDSNTNTRTSHHTGSTTRTTSVQGTSIHSDNQAKDVLDKSDVAVRDLEHTLKNVTLLQKFRLFLRSKIDQNKSEDPEYKKMGEQWLEFVIICEQVFELPEEDTDVKIGVMVNIGEQFFGKPPENYNMALKNQLNRKELINHCRNLSAKVALEPDDSLLRDGYEYVYSKLQQKHDLFRKTYPPTTRLAALMCVLS